MEPSLERLHLTTERPDSAASSEACSDTSTGSSGSSSGPAAQPAASGSGAGAAQAAASGGEQEQVHVGEALSASAASPALPVIIIGAGVAGLAVGKSLQLADVPAVVLEARGRLGGRTWTAEVGGAMLDLGGAWIHGLSGPTENPMGKLVQAAQLPHQPHSYHFVSGFDAVSQQPLTPPQWRAMWDAYKQVPAQVESLRERLGPTASMHDLANHWIAEHALDEAEARAARFAIEHALTTCDYAGPPEHVSLDWWRMELECGRDNHVVKGGYIEVVKYLAAGLDVRVDTPVQRVEVLEAQRRVRVTAANGQVFEGSRVVVTVPLAVLKAGAIEFVPPLPSYKQEAMDRLGIGCLEKVVLRYDHKWFNGSGMYIDAQQEGAWGYIADLTEATLQGAPTLVCFTGGAFSKGPRPHLTDDEMVEQVEKALACVYGVSPPKPIATAVTRWVEDPYSRGSYSFVPVGSSQDDMRQLAKPVGAHLFFAGEATCPEFHSTVHGALESGLRAVEAMGLEILLPGMSRTAARHD